MRLESSSTTSLYLLRLQLVFSSFQLIHFAPAGSTWPSPDYEKLIQLWTSPLLIQLPSKLTQERFLLMASIHYGVKINWSRFLFDILKDMVTPSSKKAQGFAVQLSILLEGVPGLTLGESKALPPLKILTDKSVSTYIAENKSVSTTSEEVNEKPTVEKGFMAVAKRIPAPASEPMAKKKRTIVGRDASTVKDLYIVPVVQEAIPISMVLKYTETSLEKEEICELSTCTTRDQDKTALDHQNLKNFRWGCRRGGGTDTSHKLGRPYPHFDGPID
ncbi:hypothetical protein F511_02163 [Dorcoceras hygrometricum]|uniref:Uncharacterized protein n=1 Tax=Dorcoceras hygrometricum TaxID=472368 RepID=A0A2Z7B8A2_9LAMI|nr:hypothetical protein F511_02163 [Dorcoceras hygrometricum]